MRRRLMTSAIGAAMALALASASSAMAAPAFVQSASGSTSGASLGVGYTSNVAAGDLLVGQFRANGTTKVSDSVNGAWTQAVSTSSEGVTHSIWYLQNAAAGKTTVTVSGATSGSLRAVLGEYSGVASSAALDQTSCNQGTATSVTTGATASVAAGDLLYAGVGLFEHPRTVTGGSSNGVSATLRTQFSGEFGTSAEEDVASTASGAQNASFTLSESAASGWAACAATFHPLGAPENTALPAISGTVEQGSTLSSTNGTWTNSPTNFAYAWERCEWGAGETCTAIEGATSSTYTLKAADVNFKIRVTVTAKNAAGSGSAAAARTAPAQSEEAAASACNKYASTSASGTENGEKAHPFKTVSQLAESLTAGQVGCLQEGQTFSASSPELFHSTFHGSAGKPVTIESSNVNNPATINAAIGVLGDYVTFTHLKFAWNMPKPWPCWNGSGNIEPGMVLTIPRNGKCEKGTVNKEDHIQILVEGEHDSFTYDDISNENTTTCIAPLNEHKGEARANETLIEHDRIHACGVPLVLPAEGGRPEINEENGWHDHDVYDEGENTIVKNNYIYGASRNGVLNHTPNSGSVISHDVIDRNGNGWTVSEAAKGEKLAWSVVTNSNSIAEVADSGIRSEEPAGENQAEDILLFGNLTKPEVFTSGTNKLAKANVKEGVNPEYVCGTCTGATPDYRIRPAYASEGFGPESPPTKY